MKKRNRILAITAVIGMLSSAFGIMPFAGEADNLNPPIAEVEQGQLRGYMDDGTYAFLGVPYASVPERYAMPEEPESWEGIRDAQTYGTICPIPAQTAVGDDEMVWPHRYWIQNENCQYLNIWTQSLDEDAKKPVLVFFHGGGYTNGSSIEAVAYEGKNLSEYGDAVVITLNHRLNILGFLDLSDYGEEYKYSANLGIADLIAALDWIHDNADSFGGDGDNITIFGQSGGGGKVLSMLHSPKAEGLVKQAIVESGSLSFNNPENNKKVTEKVLEKLDIDADSIDEIKTVPYEDLIAAGTEALAEVSEEAGSNVRWAPTADEDLLTTELCEWSSDVPMMVGSVFSEQTSTFRRGDGRKNEWTEEETMSYLTERFGDGADAVAEEFAKVFPDRKLADAYFYAPSNRQRVNKTAQEKEAAGDANVYTFLFNYEAPVNGGTTAFHCVELIYAFHNVEIPVITRATGGNEDALRIQDQVATAWLNFAKTGDPSQDGLEWKPYTSDEQNVMCFDIESKCFVLGDDTLNQLMLDNMQTN